MEFLGKSTIKVEEIEKAVRYFDKFEIGLTKSDLDKFSQTKKILKKYRDKIESIHTPHLTDEETDYLKKSDKLALELGKKLLILHSFRLITLGWEEKVFGKYFPKSEFAIENNPGDSFDYLKNSVLAKYNLCLDIAHLYIAYPKLLEFKHVLKRLIAEYKPKIKLIHLNDSSKRITGNLPIGKGEINWKTVVPLVKNFKCVIEVMPEYQLEGRKFIEKFIK